MRIDKVQCVHPLARRPKKGSGVPTPVVLPFLRAEVLFEWRLDLTAIGAGVSFVYIWLRPRPAETRGKLFQLEEREEGECECFRELAKSILGNRSDLADEPWCRRGGLAKGWRQLRSRQLCREQNSTGRSADGQ